MDEFSYLCIITVIMLLILTVTVIYLIIKKKPPLEYLYLLIGLTVGCLFLFLIPPFMTPDENTHIRAGYYVSNYFLGLSPGSLESNEIVMRPCDANLEIKNEGTREDYNYYLSELWQGKNDSNLVTLNFDLNMNSWLGVYAISAAGIALARIMGLAAIPTILLGTLFNTVFFVMVTYYCLKKLPFGKMILFTVALFPMTLQQVNSMSYDNLLFAAIFVITALSLHWRYSGDNIKISEVIIFLLASIVLLGVKGGAYALIIMLPFLLYLRTDLFTLKRLVMLGGALLLVGGAFILVFGGQVSGYIEQINNPNLPAAYISYANEYGYSLYELCHPLSNLGTLFLNTLKDGSWYIKTMGGMLLGWLNISIGGNYILLYYVVLGLAMVRKENEITCLRNWERVVIWGSCVICTGLICLSMLLYWTPHSVHKISGIQGRYFLPLLPMIAYTFRLKRLNRKKIQDEMLVIALLCLTIATCILILKYVC